jgi:hypothetical protein
MTVAAVGLDLTVQWILDQQQADGSIPWYAGGHVDPWNHVEAAMGLDVGGFHAEARRAYRWLAVTQRPDGAWPASVRAGRVVDPTLDANFVAYVAAGAWHHWLATGDEGFAEELWPAVERAIGFVLDLQSADGTFYWARDASLRPWPTALLTSCSCIHLSLGCALRLAELLERPQPEWELAMTAVADAIVREPHCFEPKDRFSMDLYYPVLGGALRGEAAAGRLKERWDEFVVPGLGARCVSDRPWVTAAETCELAMALAIAGLRDDAAALFDWVQHLRSGNGAYWTGATFPDGTRWPVEQTTWSAAAVVLAADLLAGNTRTSSFFSSCAARPVAVVERTRGPLRYSTRFRTRSVSVAGSSAKDLESTARR